MTKKPPQPPKGYRNSAHEKKEAKLIGQLARMHEGLFAHHAPCGKSGGGSKRK